jgi:F-type H+-transporting ATPase subunit alpha
MKQVAGTLKITLAQYRSLQAFAMFASDLDAASRGQLARGAALMELLKQPQLTPYPVEEQVVSLFAGTKGKLDDVPLEDVRRFEHDLLDRIRHTTDLFPRIKDAGSLDEDLENAISDAIDSFRQGFLLTDGSPLITTLSEADQVLIEQEQIVTSKRG